MSDSRSRMENMEKKVRSEWAEKIESSIEEIKSTEVAYKEKMRLQASVDYWSNKAQGHRTSAENVLNCLVWYATIGGVGLLVALAILSVIAAKNAAGDTAVYLKFAAIGAILTTAVFWGGRVILRIFLSERHLATDAEERVTMIMISCSDQ